MANNRPYYLACWDEDTVLRGRVVAGGSTPSAARRLARDLVNREHFLEYGEEPKGDYKLRLNDFVVLGLNLETGEII